MDYILGIDQSTQGTKALLFDNKGELICRTDLSHRQIAGWSMTGKRFTGIRYRR